MLDAGARGGRAAAQSAAPFGPKIASFVVFVSIGCINTPLDRGSRVVGWFPWLGEVSEGCRRGVGGVAREVGTIFCRILGLARGGWFVWRRAGCVARAQYAPRDRLQARPELRGGVKHGRRDRGTKNLWSAHSKSGLSLWTLAVSGGKNFFGSPR
eukprot:4057205-Prymnesium_polylepis.1